MCLNWPERSYILKKNILHGEHITHATFSTHMNDKQFMRHTRAHSTSIEVHIQLPQTLFSCNTPHQGFKLWI